MLCGQLLYMLCAYNVKEIIKIIWYFYMFETGLIMLIDYVSFMKHIEISNFLLS